MDDFQFTSRTYITARGRELRDEPGLEDSDRSTIWHLNISGLWDKIDNLKTAITNSPERPDVIGLCETHLKAKRDLPPDIRGYNYFYNSHCSASAGTAIYYKASLPAAEIQLDVPAEIRHRYTAAKIGDTVVVEAYAVVDSSSERDREEFFAGLIAVIHKTRCEYPQTPLILIGDHNGHIRGWHSETTNNNGRMIEHVAKRYNLEIVS